MMAYMIHLDLQEATRKLSTQIKTYSQYISPAGRFLEDMLSEASPDSMAEVFTSDFIYTL